MSDELLDEAINRICNDEVSDELIDRCRERAKTVGQLQPASRQSTPEQTRPSWLWPFALAASLMTVINIATSVANRPDPDRSIVAKATFSGQKPQVIFSDLTLEFVNEALTVPSEEQS